MTVTVTDAATEEPVAGAERDVGRRLRRSPMPTGTAMVTALRGREVEVEADGLRPGDGARSRTRATCASSCATNTVTRHRHRPGRRRRSPAYGSSSTAARRCPRPRRTATYALAGRAGGGDARLQGGPATGWRASTIGEETGQGRHARAVRGPRAVRARRPCSRAPGRLDAMLGLIDQTEANAMVIDVKETDGRLYYATDLPEAVEVGAVRDDAGVRPRGAPADAQGARHLHHRADGGHEGQHPAAVAARAGGAQHATGEPWRDKIGGAWLDPRQPGRGRVPRRHCRRPGRQGLRRGPARLHPLLQRRPVRAGRDEPAEHAVVPAAGHPARAAGRQPRS